MPLPLWPAYLGCEVPVEYTLGVQVLQALSDIQSQAEPDRPGEGFRRAEQLFQGSPIHILGQTGGEGA